MTSHIRVRPRRHLPRPDSLLKFISEKQRHQLVLGVSGAYAFPVVVFALAYRWFEVLQSQGRPVLDLGRALYFSLVIQATGGFLDISSSGGLGRWMVAFQIAIGLVWMAFLPAIVLIRLTTPDVRSVQIAMRMAFDPKTGRFGFRYANMSALMIFHTQVTVWARIPDPHSVDMNNCPVKIREHLPSDQRFGNLRSQKPFIVYTDRVAVDGHQPPSDVEAILLHPAHLAHYRDKEGAADEPAVMVNLSGETTIGSVNVYHEYRWNDIVCGVIPSVITKQGSYRWNKFDEVDEQTGSQAGEAYCRNECGFRLTCALSNKSGS